MARPAPRAARGRNAQGQNVAARAGRARTVIATRHPRTQDDVREVRRVGRGGRAASNAPAVIDRGRRIHGVVRAIGLPRSGATKGRNREAGAAGRAARGLAGRQVAGAVSVGVRATARPARQEATHVVAARAEVAAGPRRAGIGARATSPGGTRTIAPRDGVRLGTRGPGLRGTSRGAGRPDGAAQASTACGHRGVTDVGDRTATARRRAAAPGTARARAAANPAGRARDAGDKMATAPPRTAARHTARAEATGAGRAMARVVRTGGRIGRRGIAPASGVSGRRPATGVRLARRAADARSNVAATIDRGATRPNASRCTRVWSLGPTNRRPRRTSTSSCSRAASRQSCAV